MKRLIQITLLSVALLATSTLIYAQSDSSSTAPPEDTVTFSKVYTDVKAGIVALAGALKVGAEHVYEVLVKQQLTIAITNVIIYGVLLLSTYFLYKGAKKEHIAYRKLIAELKSYNWPDWSAMQVILIVGTILTALITAIVILGTLSDTLMGFTNPEYGAIREILQAI